LSRIKTTVFAIVVILVVLVAMGQAQSLGAPWIFTAVGILMIVMAAISIIRTWLHL
jgi:hypothetical protein